MTILESNTSKMWEMPHYKFLFKIEEILKSSNHKPAKFKNPVTSFTLRNTAEFIIGKINNKDFPFGVDQKIIESFKDSKGEQKYRQNCDDDQLSYLIYLILKNSDTDTKYTASAKQLFISGGDVKKKWLKQNVDMTPIISPKVLVSARTKTTNENHNDDHDPLVPSWVYSAADEYEASKKNENVNTTKETWSPEEFKKWIESELKEIPYFAKLSAKDKIDLPKTLYNYYTEDIGEIYKNEGSFFPLEIIQNPDGEIVSIVSDNPDSFKISFSKEANRLIALLKQNDEQHTQERAPWWNDPDR